MKKTIREWFALLPEPFGTQALINTGDKQLAVSKVSLAKALDGAFVWEFSPQGLTYWASLHEIAKMHGEFHQWPEIEQLRLTRITITNPQPTP